MRVKLLTKHHLEFLSLREHCTGSSESTLVKCHIVGNHMMWLKYTFQKANHNGTDQIVQMLAPAPLSGYKIKSNGPMIVHWAINIHIEAQICWQQI